MNPRLSERPESFTINGIAFPPFREALFWAKVDASADCWVWTAGRYRSGYGSFSLGNKIGGYYTRPDRLGTDGRADP